MAVISSIFQKIAPAQTLTASGSRQLGVPGMDIRVEIPSLSKSAVSGDRGSMANYTDVWANYFPVGTEKSETATQARAWALKHYPLSGVLDRRWVTVKKGGFWSGPGGLEFEARIENVIYEPKAAYWDLIQTQLDPRSYIQALCMWPSANVALIPYYLYDFENNAGAIPVPQSLDKTEYASYVCDYFSLITKWCGDQALLAASAASQTDEQWMLEYVKNLEGSYKNYLKVLHEEHYPLTEWDKNTGKKLRWHTMGLPRRLSSWADLGMDGTESGALSTPLRPAVANEMNTSISDMAGVTIPITVNGKTFNCTVQGAIRYFNQLAAYTLLRQVEKLWSRYQQLHEGRPLLDADVLLDPTRNIFLNIDWAGTKESAASGGGTVYIEESTSTAAKPLMLPKRITTGSGPSATQSLQSLVTAKSYARTLKFTDTSALASIGTEKKADGTLKYVAIAAAVVAAGYAYKQGYI